MPSTQALSRYDSYEAEPIVRDGAQLEASYSFEVELRLTGTYRKGCPATGPSYSSGGEPGEPDAVEDVDVADIGVLSAEHRTLSELRAGKRLSWNFASILEGVDRKSEAYQQIVRNILSIVGDDAEQALAEAA